MLGFSLFATISSKNDLIYRRALWEGKDRSDSLMVPPHIPPLYLPSLPCSRQPAKSYDISSPDKYNTEYCKYNAPAPQSTAEFLWMFLLLTGDCLLGRWEMGAADKLCFVVFQIQNKWQRVHNEKTHDGREQNSLSTKQMYYTLSIFLVPEPRVNSMMMGEKFNLQQEKQNGGGLVVMLCLFGMLSEKALLTDVHAWSSFLMTMLTMWTQLEKPDFSEVKQFGIVYLAVVLREENWMNLAQICKQKEAEVEMIRQPAA